MFKGNANLFAIITIIIVSEVITPYGVHGLQGNINFTIIRCGPLHA